MKSDSRAHRAYSPEEIYDWIRRYRGSGLALGTLAQQHGLSRNRLRNRLKILFWDGSGLFVCAKRLEKGTFGWPAGEGKSLCLRAEELTLLIHGIESTSRRQWPRV